MVLSNVVSADTGGNPTIDGKLPGGVGDALRVVVSFVVLSPKIKIMLTWC